MIKIGDCFTHETVSGTVTVWCVVDVQQSSGTYIGAALEDKHGESMIYGADVLTGGNKGWRVSTEEEAATVRAALTARYTAQIQHLSNLIRNIAPPEPADQPVTSHDEWVRMHEGHIHTLTDAYQAGYRTYSAMGKLYAAMKDWRASITQTSLTGVELERNFWRGWLGRSRDEAPLSEIERQAIKDAADHAADVRSSQQHV